MNVNDAGRIQTFRTALVRIIGLGALLLALAAPTFGGPEPLDASKNAAAIDPQLDWSKASLIVVQDAGRYKTLDSFARESLSAMYGQENLPGLSPLASLFEMLFNRAAYSDSPIIKVGAKVVLLDLTTEMPTAQRTRILDSGFLTPRELQDPVVQQRIAELEPINTKARAMNKVRNAEAMALFMDQMIRIVPDPDPDGTAPWRTPDQMLANASDEFLAAAGVGRAELTQRVGGAVPNVTPDQAAAVFAPWIVLQNAWRAGDAAKVQQKLDQLADVLPTFAAAGTYPKHSQRVAEHRYYTMGKLTWGWLIYFFATLVGIWALVTHWRTPWVIAMVLLASAMGFHAYGVGLRWYILDRIPVANMFEAILFSSLVGITVAFLAEIRYRKCVFLVGGGAAGFLALVLCTFALPGTLTNMMGILDDINLRIHTVMIISSYALIFVAAIIATIYLVGYYYTRIVVGKPSLATAGGVSGERPLMAGAAPGDEGRSNLPQWLNDIDWCHLIILNMVFIMLFVGTILGAVWADYSWGRPWGWDPKEVFALNTWIVYAILLHVRFVTKARGLWTAWLSIAGCTMMMFNWYFVNFYIAGLHSYA